MVTILKGTKCSHAGKLTSWTDPVKVGEGPLWILSQRKRQCTQCGEVFTSEQRIPKDNELSRQQRTEHF